MKKNKNKHCPCQHTTSHGTAVNLGGRRPTTSGSKRLTINDNRHYVRRLRGTVDVTIGFYSERPERFGLANAVARMFFVYYLRKTVGRPAAQRARAPEITPPSSAANNTSVLHSILFTFHSAVLECNCAYVIRFFPLVISHCRRRRRR